MTEREHSEQEATEEAHVREAGRAELADEEVFGALQSEPPDPDAEPRDTPARPNTSADLGSGGGTTTADPGRQDPIIPGEGKL